MLTFKEKADLTAWRSFFGKNATTQPSDRQRTVINWVSLFNAKSETLTGKSAVVTSWIRDDNTSHFNGEAVDFRIRHYTRAEQWRLHRWALNRNIPIVKIRPETPDAHWHVGDLATLAFER